MVKKKEEKKIKKETNRITKIKVVILSILIAIVSAAFVVYLIQSIHANPKWEDYCGNVRHYPKPVYDSKGTERPINQTECEATNGTWIDGSSLGYCDYYHECQNQYNNATDKHKNIVFLVSVPVGLIAVGVGIILALPSFSSGLMLGGVILTIYGVSQYWGNLSNWIRTLILGIVLIILMWFAYKKLKG